MDILVQESGSGGELLFRNKDLVMAYLYENMPYLALFGGDDWYMNELITGDESLKFLGRTERVCRETVLNSAGRLVIEEAATADLQFLLANIPGSTLRVTVVIISDDRIRIDIVFNGVLISYYYDKQFNTMTPGAGLYMTEDGGESYVTEDGTEGYTYL